MRLRRRFPSDPGWDPILTNRLLGADVTDDMCDQAASIVMAAHGPMPDRPHSYSMSDGSPPPPSPLDVWWRAYEGEIRRLVASGS